MAGAALLACWGESGAALEDGGEPGAGPDGVSLTAADEELAMVALGGIIGLCPEQTETVRTLVERGR